MVELRCSCCLDDALIDVTRQIGMVKAIQWMQRHTPCVLKMRAAKSYHRGRLK